MPWMLCQILGFVAAIQRLYVSINLMISPSAERHHTLKTLDAWFMNHLLIEVLGYVAAALTTISFAPQAWLIWKNRSAAGVSLGMYSVFVTGIGVWLIYGVLIESWPLVASNAATFLLSGLILVMKLRYA